MFGSFKKAIFRRFPYFVNLYHVYRSSRSFSSGSRSFVVSALGSAEDDFNSLCETFGTDKGGRTKTVKQGFRWVPHNYADLYQVMFHSSREKMRVVVECGIGTNNPDLVSSMGVGGEPGASLRAWEQYFPNAEIIGLDVDKDILFGAGRITCMYCDQTDSASVQAVAQGLRDRGRQIDILIDDGLHEFRGGKVLFEGLFPLVRPGGWYIIEDVIEDDVHKYVEFLAGRPHYVFHGLRDGAMINDNRLILIPA